MRIAPFLLAASSLSLLACTNASPSAEGGDFRFDASPQPSSATTCGDPTADAGDGHRFSDLYRDYFGPTGIASCAGTAGACHGDPTATGASKSEYICPNDASNGKSCYQGMVSGGLFVPGDTSTAPENTFLYVTLRKCTGSGVMPKEPSTVVFSAADLQRIKDWLAAGAPND